MKRITKRTRLRITLYAFIVLMILAFFSTWLELEMVATAAIGGMMTILTSYIWGETRRPSITDNNNQNIIQ